jgi:hypothetical protein
MAIPSPDNIPYESISIGNLPIEKIGEVCVLITDDRIAIPCSVKANGFAHQSSF